MTAILYLPGKIAAALLPKNPFAQTGPWQDSLNELAKQQRAKHLPGPNRRNLPELDAAIKRMKKINRRP